MTSDKNSVFSSFWISASAGTGKTKSLIDRILVLLLNGVAPSKILCLTYTKSAASEMLIRLSNELQKMSCMSDDELRENLRSLGVDESALKIAKSLYEKSADVSRVSIQTVHSFCFQLLGRFPMETGLLPGIKMCDDYKSNQLINEAIRAVLADDSSDLKIIAEHTLDIFDFIKDNEMKICRFVDRAGDLKKTYGDFFDVDPSLLDMSDEEIDNFLFRKFFQNNHREIFANLAEKLSLGGLDDKKKSEILKKNSVSPTSSFILAFLTEKKTLRKKLCTAKITDRNVVEKMQIVAQKALDFWEEKKQIASAKVNAAFGSVIIRTVEKFRELKTLNHCLNFNDIIMCTTDLLQNLDWVMYKIDNAIDHILIDEAQDTAPEQWEIIRLITEEFFSHYQSNRTIFVVGDEKQSIYSFQGADVKLFRKMRDYFSENVKKSGQDFYNRPLNKSYRTTGNILAFVDKVFSEKFPGISHSTSRNPHSGVVEIVDLFESDETEAANKKLSRYIADFIKKTIADGVFVESRQRPARAEDFLILFQRRHTETMQLIINALKKEGIPVGGIDRILINDELIAEDLIALAEFAVFPLDDLMCARVLKSPIVGMTENDLMHACIDRGEEHLWDYVLKNYDVKNLKNYVDKALELSAYDFFMYVLADGVKEKFIGRLGERCLDVLYEFLGLVMNYERENTASLQSFLKWFRLFASEHEIKRESFADENVVRLMTAHASKGLQSPFVILADAHFLKNERGKILKTADEILLWDFSENYRPQKVEQLRLDQNESDDGELYRLLYVAMTRAEDFLYVLGEKHQNQLNSKCWYSFLKQFSE